jgi:hypothetical protein
MALGINRWHRDACSVQAGRCGDNFAAQDCGHPELNDAGARTALEVDDVDRKR